ncbi:MAG: hypothetical protein HYW07_01640 [Candidatus Latescibacteria bacterium]|nr:hypothetical protein [Candidatus Latescibacterota bacterium]
MASNKERKPNPFTGFDPADNLQMHQLWPNDQSGTPKGKLLHVVNVTLNLVSGDKLAWQQRKAATFAITLLHSGNGRLGYRRSKDYGKYQGRAITLGTAMTISGAAVSPNMGYHSSPVVAFILTLFNAPWHDEATKKGEQRHCAIGRIGYSEVDKDGKDGVLVYTKPVICGSEPRDVLHYAEASPSFPHESTGDQWFSEAQFESYRALGLHTVEQIFGEEWAGRELGDFVRAMGDYLDKSAKE